MRRTFGCMPIITVLPICMWNSSRVRCCRYTTLKEEISCPHPSLEPVLKRTLGVPLFQEQLLRMAMTVANFTGAEAEELRRAVGMRRSWERMKNLEGKLRDGMTANGLDAATQETIIQNISSR